jgi:hypothetical protein
MCCSGSVNIPQAALCRGSAEIDELGYYFELAIGSLRRNVVLTSLIVTVVGLRPAR